MNKKITYTIGILVSLLAAFELVRFTAFLPRLRVSRPSYILLTVLSISYVFLFIRAWKGKLTDILKWIGVVISVGGIILMMATPFHLISIQVVIRIYCLLFASAGCLMFTEAQENSKMFPWWGKLILIACYSFLFIALAVTLTRLRSEAMQDPAVKLGQRILQIWEESQTKDTAVIQASVEGENELNFRWVLPPEYYRGSNFNEGRVWVQEKKDGPWTLFDSDGNVIKKDFMARDVWQGQFSNTNTRFRTLKKDSKTGWDMYGVLDLSGDIIVEPEPYKSAPYLYKEGLASQKGENGLWGCIDFHGNWVISPIYETGGLWSEGLKSVKKGGKWGYINAKGEVVIDLQFENAQMFSNGLAAVSQNSLYGLIDKNGNWVVEAIYDGFDYPLTHPIAAQKNGKIGYLDAKGNVVIDFKFEANTRFSSAFREGRAIVPLSKKGEGRNAIYKLAVINESGDIIPTKQDDFMTHAYSNGFAVAVRNNRLFMLDRDGKEYALPNDFQKFGVEVNRSDEGIFKVHFQIREKIGYFKVGN